MNAQETFDRIVGHLRRQKKQARKGSQCQYRAPNGCQCAVGCLIPDHLYKPEFEGKGIEDLINDYGMTCVFGADKPDVRVARTMQNIHDGCIDIKDWERRFKNTASDMKIKYTPPIAA